VLTWIGLYSQPVDRLAIGLHDVESDACDVPDVTPVELTALT
jgi:hypothetical protein